jgi:CheY-like chemotaxis protein
VVAPPLTELPRRYHRAPMAGQEGMLAALVVEDDEIVRSFLARVLERLGYRVDGAATAAEAEAFASTEPGYAIILLDGLLPDRHGLRLARGLLEEPRLAQAAICLLSGTVRLASPVTAGFSALPKPPRLAALIEHIHAMEGWRAVGSPPEERRAALLALDAGLPVG